MGLAYLPIYLPTKSTRLYRSIWSKGYYMEDFTGMNNVTWSSISSCFFRGSWIHEFIFKRFVDSAYTQRNIQSGWETQGNSLWTIRWLATFRSTCFLLFVGFTNSSPERKNMTQIIWQLGPLQVTVTNKIITVSSVSLLNKPCISPCFPLQKWLKTQPGWRVTSRLHETESMKLVQCVKLCSWPGTVGLRGGLPYIGWYLFLASKNAVKWWKNCVYLLKNSNVGRT